jgi:hypothetical protein
MSGSTPLNEVVMRSWVGVMPSLRSWAAEHQDYEARNPYDNPEITHALSVRRGAVTAR